MTVSDVSEELQITVRGGRSRGRWPVILVPAAFLTSLPLLTIPLVGWEGALPSMLPRLGPVILVCLFLTLFEATRSEVLTVHDGVLEVAQFWLGGRRIWSREAPVLRIRRLRYELEAGLCFFAGPRTVAVDFVDGKKRRFGVALSPEQANRVIEVATRRLVKVEIPTGK